MFVLFLGDIQFTKKLICAGDIYEVVITPCSGGYSLIVVSPEFPKGFGSIPIDYDGSDLESALYITSSHTEVLVDFWNANRDYYLAREVKHEEVCESQLMLDLP